MTQQEEKAELQAVIQEWDENARDGFGSFDSLVDALWAAGYRRLV